MNRKKNLKISYYNEKKISKVFILVTGLSYNVKLKTRKVGENVKIQSKYNQDNTLHPIFTKGILFLYTSDFHRVKIHQKKTASHI